MAITSKRQFSSLGSAQSGQVAVQFHKVTIHLLLIFDVIFSSRMNRILGDWLQPVVLSSSAAIVLYFAVLAFISGYVWQLLLLMGSLWLVMHQLQQSSTITSLPYVPNLGFMFTFTMTFAVYFMVSKLQLRAYLVRTLAFYATIYAVSYTIVAVLYSVGALPHQVFEPLILSDIERGDRLFAYSAASAFAWLYWLEMRGKSPFMGNIMLALCGIGIILTLSRYFIICVALITLLRMASVSQRNIGRFCFVILSIAAVVYLYGLVNVDWNPFSGFSGDSSGDTRIKEYDAARFALLAHPLFGFGLTADDKAVSAVVGDLFFSSGDIGIIGIWWDFGLIGIVLFMIGSYICCKPISGLSSDLAGPLFLTGCMMVLYNAVAPIIFYAGGSNYFCIILGLYLDQSSAQRGGAGPSGLAPVGGAPSRHTGEMG